MKAVIAGDAREKRRGIFPVMRSSEHGGRALRAENISKGIKESEIKVK
jgi:hypothetical protein